MDRTATVNLGAPGLSLGARLYVGGVARDASSVVVNDRGEGDYDFDVPLSPPYSLIVFETADAARALWIFPEKAPAAYRPLAIPSAIATTGYGLTRVVVGADTELQLEVSGLPADPGGAGVELRLHRIGGALTVSGVAGEIRDVVEAGGRYAGTLFAALPWSAWPTDPSPTTGYYFGQFHVDLGWILPADTSLRLELSGAPS